MLNFLSFSLFICVILGFETEIISSRKAFPAYLPPPEVREGVTLPEELWFTQVLDHFDPTDLREWQQKYFINDTFYENGGPIFVMIGGEGPAGAKWMVNGSWVTYGIKYKALLVQLEHRFYGDSHPTEDLSVENLRYLSSEQAIADLAYFSTKFKEERNLTDNKVIAFGGSYAGNLATWFRLKYPHVVHGSVSSSAPLLAQINFKEYLDVTTASLASKGSTSCLQEISKANQYIYINLQSTESWVNLENLFRLCAPLDGQNENDVSNLFELLTENFETVVQYNEDNRDFGVGNGPDVTIGTVCDIMTDESYGNALERYAVVNSLQLNISEENCLNHTYSSMIEKLKQTEWGKGSGRQWIYQTCTEFGYYQTSDSPNQPFGSSFPLDFFTQQCTDIYGEKFNTDLLQKGVERTNIMYGAKNPKVTRVVLVNGSIDPWHYLGVLQDLNEDTPAIYINGTAHCADMYPATPNDPVQLTEARQEIEDLIGQWLQED